MEKKTDGKGSTAGRHATSVHSSETSPSDENSIPQTGTQVKKALSGAELQQAYLAELKRLEEEELFAELERDWYDD